MPTMLIRASLMLITLLPAVQSQAGKYNQKLSVGDDAPAWVNLPGIDGNKYSLGDCKDKKAVVVVFTCNSCPYAVDVEDRLIALHKKYAERGVGLIAINVNQVEEDALAAMKEKATKKKFPFVYLYDESQQIARDFGAIYTPEFYVLNEHRKVVYMGALDDSPDGKNVTVRYVEQAIEAALSGNQPQVAETPAIGCRVRYQRERRRRSQD